MSKTFIHEFRLKTSLKEEKQLLIILEQARFLYNAVLSEGLKRLKLIKDAKQNAKEKNYQIYKELNKLYKFSDYSLQAYAIEIKNKCSIKDHLDTHACQKIATRAYLALKKYLKRKAGKPRFKSKNRLSSVEGKSNKSGLRFRNNQLCYKGLKIEIILDDKDNLQKYAHS